MIISDLRKLYTDDQLSFFPGDAKLRFEAFSPILSDLHESKIVYREKCVCILSLHNIEISKKCFAADCTLMRLLHKPDYLAENYPRPQWKIRGRWDWMRLINNSINIPYVGWTIWPEKHRVKEVLRLTSQGDIKAALALTANEPGVS
jgi:hypothetical protein